MPTEELLTCPDCHTPNFSKRGLQSHRGNKNCQYQKTLRRPAADQSSDPTSTESVAPGLRLSATSPEATAPQAGRVVPPGCREIKTLEDLDTMSSRHTLLSEMTLPQLAETSTGLELAVNKGESVSGIAATLNGLVLTEVKKRVGHSNFTPWLEKNFPKSKKTARLYMSVAGSFSKTNPKVPFEQLTLALPGESLTSDGQIIDLAHPTVSSVAKWTKGRSFYQLRQEVLKQGGNNHPKCPHCDGDLASATQEHCPHCGKATGQSEPTPEERRAELAEQTREWAHEQITDSRIEKKLYRVLADHDAQALAAHYRAAAQEIDAWLKTPARKREQLALEEVLA